MHLLVSTVALRTEPPLRSKPKTQQPDGRKIRGKLLRLLGRRDYSVKEIRNRLRRLGADPALTDLILGEFLKKGWLDDQRFALAYARSRSVRGFGPQRLLLELRSKGVEDSLARQTVNEVVGEEECRQAKALAQKRFRMGKDRDSTYRFLARRGFRGAAIREALGEWNDWFLAASHSEM